ncbi:LysR family transcriptional regulator [Vibrio sp. WXL210]|uniref:LysR family transcriptional regulator n=1 Tax=Vibrio sp. WXL210 TaxID=3450709 RepID=UPI003EC646B8
MQQIDLKLLTVFCAVVESGSMTEAANQLGVNQSAVSQAIQRLKTQLGTELFIRQTRGVKPTAAGRALYNQLSVDLDRIAQTLTGLSAFDAAQSQRTFDLSCPEICHTRLLQSIPFNDNSRLKVVLHNQPESSDALVKQLLDRERDLFIDVVVPDHPSILGEQLTQEKLCVIASKDHPRLGGNHISMKQFLSEPYIKFNRTRDNRAGIQSFTQAYIHDLNIVAYSQSIFEIMVLVSQTDKISTLSVSMAKDYRDKLGLAIYELPFSSNPVNLYMLWHKAQDNNAGSQWLREQLKQLYQA